MPMDSLYSIEMLIHAAEFLERKDREAEHGYASTAPMPDDYTRRRGSFRTRKSLPRSTHNELEKNRRAHLRHCLDALKKIVPLDSESSKHTTLGLLKKAKSYIRRLEEKDHTSRVQKDQLNKDNRHLRRRIQQLGGNPLSLDVTFMTYRNRVDRSFSECSASTLSTSSSNSYGSSESDEIDILGDGSSDTDDHSSINSNSSDGVYHYYTRQTASSSLL